MKTIGLIEDNDKDRGIIAQKLEKMGYKVEVPYRFSKVLEFAFRDDIDILVIDAFLGCVSGIEIMRLLKRKKFTKPVYLISGIDNKFLPELNPLLKLIKPAAFIQKQYIEEDLKCLAS